MYAIIEFQGKQFKVEKGHFLDVPKMENAEEGQEVSLQEVMVWCNEEGTVEFGRPYIAGASIKAKVVVPMLKDKKVIVFKHNRAKNYRRKKGHRQQMTRLVIQELHQLK